MVRCPAFPYFCTTQALWGWLVAAWLAAPLNSAQPPAPIKVLFVGNSYLNAYFNPVLKYNTARVIDENAGLPVSSRRHEFPSDAAGPWAGVPGIFKKFTDQARLNYEVHLETINNVPLHYHYDNALTVIQRAGWDQVVLQELSTQPLPLAHGGQPADFATYVALLEQAIHVVGASPRARIYLFETWARADLTYPANQPYSGQPIDSMAQHLHNVYFRVAAKSPRLTGVAPVGDAWLRAIRKGVATRSPYAPTASRLNLWATDNSHASMWGSYLAACVLFGRLTGLDPRTLGAAEQAAAALGITPSGATALQSIAFDELSAGEAYRDGVAQVPNNEGMRPYGCTKRAE